MYENTTYLTFNVHSWLVGKGVPDLYDILRASAQVGLLVRLCTNPVTKAMCEIPSVP